MQISRTGAVYVADSLSALKDLGIDVTQPAALLEAGNAFFKKIVALADVAAGLNPMLGMLADSNGLCSDNSSVISPSPWPGAPTKADALQCAALASAGLTATSRFSVSFAGVTRWLDISECPSLRGVTSANLTVISLQLPGISASALTASDVLSSQSRLYGLVKTKLSAPSRSTSIGLAKTVALPPLPGMGFCFTPTITEGPCAQIRIQLASFARQVKDGVQMLYVVEPFVTTALPKALGPALASLFNVFRDTVLPIISGFIRGAADFAITILNSIGISLAPAARPGRLLANGTAGGHEPWRDVLLPSMSSAGRRMAATQAEGAALHALSFEEDVEFPFSGRRLQGQDTPAYAFRSAPGFDVADRALDALFSDDTSHPLARRRRALAASGSSGMSRRLYLSMSVVFDIFDTVVAFVDTGEKWLSDIADQFTKTEAFQTIAGILDTFMDVARPVSLYL